MGALRIGVVEMGIKFNDRFENHMDGIDAGTKGDAKKIADTEDDAYDDGFDEKLSDVSVKNVDGCVGNSDKQDASEKSEDGAHMSYARKIDKDGVINAKSNEKLSTALSEPVEVTSKRTLSGKPATDVQSYTMNTPKTVEHMREQMDDKEKAYFDSQIDAGGGVDGQRAHLRGVGHEYFMTSSANKKASGNFLTEESPGETSSERKENLQLPPENDAADVDKVISQKPAIVLISKVAPQKEWAKQSGYEAKEGIKQVFTPNLNKGGAIKAGIYEIKQSKKDMGNGNIESMDGTVLEKGNGHI